MKLRLTIAALCISVLTLSAQVIGSQENINDNWTVGGAQKTLPLDYAYSLPMKTNYTTNLQYRDYGEEAPVFTKVLDVVKCDYVAVRFEGINGESKVYLNGVFLGSTSQPDVPYTFELTPYMKFNAQDTLSVCFSTSNPEAGIVRNVSLVRKNAVHFTSDGVKAVQIISGNNAELRISASVENTSHAASNVVVRHSLRDPRGTEVATANTPATETGPRRTNLSEQIVTVANPQRWSLTNPVLYTLVSTVLVNEVPVDQYICNIGFRTLDYLPQTGFLLNGTPVSLHPLDFDQSCYFGGDAVADAYIQYQVADLKKQGCNIISTGGRPASEVLLSACDAQGMLVIDEAPSVGVNAEQINAAAAMVASAGNHPSVIFWGAGRDLPEDMAHSFSEILRSLDYSRKTVSFAADAPDWNLQADNTRYSTRTFATEPGPQQLAQWSSTPAVYMEPEWSLSGKEGRQVVLTVYSNCERVNLGVNGITYSSKEMVNGKAEWTATYKPGRVDLVGYNKNKIVVRKTYNTAGYGYQIKATPNKLKIKGDGEDVIVMDIQMLDSKGNPTTDANMNLRLYIDDNALNAYGVSNSRNNVQFAPIQVMGAPGVSEVTFPVKDGKGRIVLRSVKGATGIAHVRVGGDSLHGASFNINYE
ncbi:MAG: DUF4982 domain-containing protein [Bacteroidales bacterium]|nr:DUF4982 domain-containing protein [Bacteroidales bacterium]